MSERGGPTTQSGILYQNTIAALYLARLVDTRSRPASDKVIRVAVESLDHVDDVVLYFSDGHRDYLQVKEAIDKGKAWEKLWRDFKSQVGGSNYSNIDRVVLVTAQATELIVQLQEMCKRAQTSRDHLVWLSRLPATYQGSLASVKGSFDPVLSDEDCFSLLSRVHVECWGTLEQIERDHLPLWVPDSDSSHATVFSLLRDMVGGEARVRGEFTVPTLLERLNRDHHVNIKDQHDQVNLYQRSLLAVTGSVDLPGTSISGPIEGLFVWPKVVEEQPVVGLGTPLNADDLDEALEVDETVDLREFPQSPYSRAIVVAGAGFGKTTLLKAVANRLLKESPIWVPAFVSLPELSDSGEGLIEYLHRKTRSSFDCEVDWSYYLDSGRAVLLLDGLDEVLKNRATVLELLRQLSGRYSEFSWLLAVRDSAAVSVQLGVPYLRICALDDNGVEAMVDAYHRGGTALSYQDVLKHRWGDSEFKRLSSIPFFLALLLVTTQEERDLTKGRTRLLEQYVFMALSPAEYRPGTHVSNDSGHLFEAAQLLAEEALRSSGSGLSDHKAQTLLRQAFTAVPPDSLLKDLVVCGIVRRSPGWISFSFPIVQEYLTSVRLCVRGVEAVIERFDSLRSRPWAQTVQFAVEQLPDADPVLSQLLSMKDDAYSSVLRVVARAAVHGARVSLAVQRDIAARLGAIWLKMPTYRLDDEVGGLLADGFIGVLPDGVLRFLQEARGLLAGGGRMIVAIDDPKLTGQVLDSYLAQSLRYRSHLHDFQPAVDRIANEALSKYVERATKAEADEIGSLGSMIVGLNASLVDPGVISFHLAKANLPGPVRLGLLVLGGCKEGSGWREVVLDILSSDGTEVYEAWSLATEALWKFENPGEIVTSMLANDSTEENVERWLSAVMAAEVLSSQSKSFMLQQLISGTHHNQLVVWGAQMMLIGLGDETYLEKLLGSLAQLPLSYLRALSMQVTQLVDTTWVLKLCSAAEELGRVTRSTVATSLSAGLSYELEGNGFGAWLGRHRRRHPAASACSEVFYRWAQDDCDFARLDLLARSSDLGHLHAEDELFQVVPKVFKGVHSDRDHNRLAHWIHVLERRKRLFPIPVLTNMVLHLKRSNDARACVSMLGRHGDEGSLEALLKLRSEDSLDHFVHESIESSLERLASQLGITLDRNPEGLPVRQNEVL